MVVILTHSSLCPLCPCVCLDQSGSLSSRQVSGVVAATLRLDSKVFSLKLPWHY